MHDNSSFLSTREKRVSNLCGATFAICVTIAVLGTTALNATGGTAMEGKVEGKHYFLGYAAKGQHHLYRPVLRLNFRLHQSINDLFLAGIPTMFGSFGALLLLEERSRKRRRQQDALPNS